MLRASAILLLGALAASGCDGTASSDPGVDGGGGTDAGGETDGRAPTADGATGRDGSTSGDSGPPPGATTFALPADGSEVIHSVAVRVNAPDEATRVVVGVVGEDAECTADVRDFECLLDVTALAPGAFTVRATSFDASDAELGQTDLELVRREVPDPCEGVTGDHIDCVLERATAGTSAGFDGVSYLNYDDRHALVSTDRMTGIDAQVHAAVPVTPPDGVVMGIANESRACRPTGGWSSRPRCDSVPRALGHYEANVFVFWPEHRDHGTRDYFQWQAEIYDMSQGSSGSERDEVSKMLTALGMMAPDARSDMVDAGTVASTVAMLLRRSRLGSDAEYLTPEAHVTALGNADNGALLMALSAALRTGEVPPIARVTAEDPSFPDDWSMMRSLGTDYALGWSPITLPTETPAGTFEVVVDVSTSTDPSGRDLVFFPALLRGDPADVTVERASDDGTRWRVTGSFPVDRTITTGGHDRTVSRVTVGIFPHNGLWLGAPALVSVGGRPTHEPAPDSNNLD